MMHQQNGDALPTQLEQPILNRNPSIARALAGGRGERRKVVQNHQVDILQQRVKGLLSFYRAEIDAAFNLVRRQDSECIVRNIASKTSRNWLESLLQ